MSIMHQNSGRRLPWYCLAVLLLFVSPTTAQSNPDEAPCGLPVGGSIGADANWTLNANCDQTSRLSVDTPPIGDPGFTITINGNGHTIRLGAGNWQFLQAASNRHTVNLNNVTIDGQLNQRSVIIQVGGELNAENVTFTRGDTGVFVFAGSATLENVLFEDIVSTGLGFGANGGALNVASSHSVTLNNAVIRKVRTNGVVVHKGGTLTTTGCLAFYGSPAYDVIHSEVWDGGGTWNDNSSGPCRDTIGNGDKARLPAPPMLGCRMPASALIDSDVTWTLTGDCVSLGSEFLIGEGATLRIRGNGFRLYGDSTSSTRFQVGANATLELDNLVLDSVRLRSYDGTLKVTRAEMYNANPTGIVNYGGTSSFSNTRFENNSTARFESLLYGRKSFATDSVATFGDAGFYNNTGGTSMLGVDKDGATLNLEGSIIFEGNTSPDFTASSGATVNDNRGSCASPPLLGPVGPLFQLQPGEHDPRPVCFQRLGAIGLICRVDNEPGPAIEIWGVTPESRGFFILEVRQPEVDAVRPEGLVACSADGRVALRVHGDRSITVSMGPAPNGKTHHVTLQNHLNDHVIGTFDTFSGQPCDPASPLPPAPTPAPSARAVTPQTPRADGSIVHVVQEGDTLWAIAGAYGIIYPHEIVERNGLADNGNWLAPGQELIIREGS